MQNISKYIGYTGEFRHIKILFAGKTVYCLNAKERELKYNMYCNYQNTCRVYRDEY